MFEKLIEKGFDVQFVSHAAAILGNDFPSIADELENALLEVDIPIQEIIGSGGGEAKGTQRLRRALAARGWKKHNFEIKKTIDGVERESISHEIDHVRRDENGVVVLEIEWNNKDPFFDRDLENFKRLHAEGAISVGLIVTRGTTMQDQLYDFVLKFARTNQLGSISDLERIGLSPTPRQRAEIMKPVNRARNTLPFDEAWAGHFVGDKFATSTTHWGKLQDRVSRGVGNPCPLILIGLPAAIISFPSSPMSIDADADDEADQST